jgi:hypothetical protein
MNAADQDVGTARVREEPMPLTDEQVIVHRRPATRAECEPGGWNVARPCPFVGCRYHLMLDVSLETGHIKHSAADINAMRETCAIDVAERGGLTLDEVGHLIGVTRERVRQIEAEALLDLRAKLEGEV